MNKGNIDFSSFIYISDEFNFGEKDFIRKSIDYGYKVFLNNDFKKEFNETDFKQSKGMSGMALYAHFYYKQPHIFIIKPFSRPNSNIRAYTKNGEIFLNKFHFDKWFSKQAFEECASTSFHEQMHVLEFHHSKWKPWEKLKTVPYLIGKLIKKFILKELKNDKRKNGKDNHSEA